MCVPPILVLSLLLQFPSPTITPKAAAQGAEISEPVRDDTKAEANKNNSPSETYLVHEVSPPAPKDTPLFLPYLIATILGVSLNGFVSFLIWRQGRFMKQQLIEMGKQTSAALSTARATENNYQIMRNAERPWVLIDKIEISEFEANQKLYCSVFVKNYGRTPAFLTNHKFVFRLMNSIPTPPLEYSPFPFEFQQEVITPSSSAKVYVPLHEERLTLRQMESLRNRKEYLYAFGFFKYRDASENEYETCFFQVYDLPTLQGQEFMTTGPVEYNRVK